MVIHQMHVCIHNITRIFFFFFLKATEFFKKLLGIGQINDLTHQINELKPLKVVVIKGKVP
jgi:hypothetical protein